jgi:hypothetical protein
VRAYVWDVFGLRERLLGVFDPLDAVHLVYALAALPWAGSKASQPQMHLQLSGIKQQLGFISACQAHQALRWMSFVH